jgi:hypothetical protein
VTETVPELPPCDTCGGRPCSEGCDTVRRPIDSEDTEIFTPCDDEEED